MPLGSRRKELVPSMPECGLLLYFGLFVLVRIYLAWQTSSADSQAPCEGSEYFQALGGFGRGADIEGSRPAGPLLALLKRHCWCLRVYISAPELHFSICSCQWQLLNFPDASSKWVERWQKNLLWFKWVRGQCYSVCLIIYLPSYTQHLLSLEWFKHIITSCFSSFIMLVCCYSLVRNLSWPLQSRGCHLILLHFDVPPPWFF